MTDTHNSFEGFFGEFFLSKRSWTSLSQSWICLYVGWRCTSPSKSSKVLLSPKASHFWGKISPKMSATSLNQTSSHSVRSLFLWNRQMETKSLVSLFTFTWGGKSFEALGSWTRNHHLCAPYFLLRHSANVAYVTGTQICLGAKMWNRRSVVLVCPSVMS